MSTATIKPVLHPILKLPPAAVVRVVDLLRNALCEFSCKADQEIGGLIT